MSRSGAQAGDLNEIFGGKAADVHRRRAQAQQPGPQHGPQPGQQHGQQQEFDIGSGNPRDRKMPRQAPVHVDLPMPRAMNFADASGVPVPMEVGAADLGANNGD